MKVSNFPIFTQKDVPSEAEITSHQLMIKSGMIRKLSSGQYSWLPIGLRVIQKIEKIIREELNNIGCAEILMPSVQPAELWKESGRWDEYGPELLRFKDRHEREFCLGPTFEEVITSGFDFEHCKITLRVNSDMKHEYVFFGKSHDCIVEKRLMLTPTSFSSPSELEATKIQIRRILKYGRREYAW